MTPGALYAFKFLRNGVKHSGSEEFKLPISLHSLEVSEAQRSLTELGWRRPLGHFLAAQTLK